MWCLHKTLGCSYASSSTVLGLVYSHTGWSHGGFPKQETASRKMFTQLLMATKVLGPLTETYETRSSICVNKELIKSHINGWSNGNYTWLSKDPPHITVTWRTQLLIGWLQCCLVSDRVLGPPVSSTGDLLGAFLLLDLPVRTSHERPQGEGLGLIPAFELTCHRSNPPSHHPFPSTSVLNNYWSP